MFTGIVEEIGEVTDVAPSGDGVRLTVRAPKAVSDAAHGDSISVSGVCLTVVDQGEDWFTADVMKQTLDMSTLAGVGAGRVVNLERATQAHGRLGGHIVQGHIDGTGDVLEVRHGAQWRVLRISLPAELAPLVVDKGSIAVDGISLTVSAVSASNVGAAAHWFEVSLIPETLEATTLGERGAGDRVNLETDILARHVQRLLSFTAAAVPRAPRGYIPDGGRPRAPRGYIPDGGRPRAPRARLPDGRCRPHTFRGRRRVHGRRLTMSLSTIPEALEALSAGRPVIVADDENRENEGDVVLSAELATPEWVAWTVRWSSGFICAPMPAEWADRLDLPPMVAVNEDARGTAYTVSVDAADRDSTGISASDRAHTLNVLANPASTPGSVKRPGHILPLRAVDGGVRERGGHTEASVELMRLAGLKPVAAIAEIVAEDGSMMRLPGLIDLGARDGVPVITIEQLIAFLNETEPLTEGERSAHKRRVSLRAEANVPTGHGDFRFLAYKDRVTGTDHVAVVSGDLLEDAPLVRVHSECLTGEAFGSLKCECGPQLEAALDAIDRDGGVVIYMRGHEGRGIGLINKLRAYSLQERGLDTVDANLALGLPADARDYAAAAGILADLGVEKVRLLTNNSDKVNQLRELGLDIVEQVPLLVGVGPNNHQYLATKRDRMGHVIDERELADALALLKETHLTGGASA